MEASELFKLAPWTTLQMFEALAIKLKQDFDMPEYAAIIASGTAIYEEKLRQLWEAFKLDPTEDNARKLAAEMKKYSKELWPEVIAASLGLDVVDLTSEQQLLLEEKLTEHHEYIEDSLVPDLIKGVQQNIDFSNLDYRVVFLYAGALWSVGFLASIMFDGLSMRDLADVFIFAGPNDEETCIGPRGCKQHANKLYTVAQILAGDIIPGRMKCLTSCRHMLLPVVSPLKEPSE